MEHINELVQSTQINEYSFMENPNYTLYFVVPNLMYDTQLIFNQTGNIEPYTKINTWSTSPKFQHVMPGCAGLGHIRDENNYLDSEAFYLGKKDHFIGTKKQHLQQMSNHFDEDLLNIIERICDQKIIEWKQTFRFHYHAVYYHVVYFFYLHDIRNFVDRDVFRFFEPHVVDINIFSRIHREFSDHRNFVQNYTLNDNYLKTEFESFKKVVLSAYTTFDKKGPTFGSIWTWRVIHQVIEQSLLEVFRNFLDPGYFSQVKHQNSGLWDPMSSIEENIELEGS